MRPKLAVSRCGWADVRFEADHPNGLTHMATGSVTEPKKTWQPRVPGFPDGRMVFPDSAIQPHGMADQVFRGHLQSRMCELGVLT